MKLIVGLGNIGKEYENTRHNIGFMIVDNYLHFPKYQEKFNSYYYKTVIDGKTVLFLKPKTFMNNSGIAIKEFVDYFDIDIDDILVIHDDLDQEFMSFKLKKNSSSGGHNGIKSIISSLGTDAFMRLKIGINNNHKKDTIDFVLGNFEKKELEYINDNYNLYSEIIDSFIRDGSNKTMNIYNTKRD